MNKLKALSKKISVEVESKDTVSSEDIEKTIAVESAINNNRLAIVDRLLIALKIFIGFLLTVWGVLISLKFESTGTVSSISGKEFIKGLFHFKA